MAALVSEYTLEFFTLLNARGKKELIEWCMKEGLIASSYECPKCNEQMGLNERKSVVLDGFEWRCQKKEFEKMDPNKILWPALKYSNRFLLKVMKNRHYFSLGRSMRKYSTENAETEEITIKEKFQMTRPTVTQWKRPPFMKDFFRGKFDVELLAFPEILDKEQVIELEDNVKILNGFMAQKVNSEEIDKIGGIPEDVLQELKDMGLFGRTLPAKYGGLHLTHSASTRLNEVLGLNLSIGCTLAAHEFFAAQAILQFGSEAQKSQYLPRMASGDLIGALCCSEMGSGSDLLSMSTTAKKSPDGNFVLSGTKSWVTNAGMAGLFIVFAKTQNELDPKEHDISAFIVEKNSKDLKVTLHDKLCLRGVQTGVVQFEEVVVPGSNLIGKLGQGFQIYLKSLESFRIAMSSLTIGTLKAFLDSVTNHIIHCERLNKSLADYQLVRTRLSRISSMLYGMESASYFTAAILDSTVNPDVALESAAIKLFNSEGALYCLRELMEALGSSSLLPGCQLEKYHRDVLGLSMFDGPNDIARLYLSLSGFKYVGDTALEFVKKLRNPFFFPLTMMKLQFIRFKHRQGYIKYNQDLAGHIHPSLVEWGNKLERYLLHFEDAVNDLLAEHGKDIVDAQIDPRKLSYIATEFYVWSAVLSRCSRSYCLGMRNCHHELRLAEAFCFDSYYRFGPHFDAIALGITKNNERNHLFQGEQIVDCQGYFLEHPLKHNY
ncbi:complex I assembly factor ACAD9, mitochondrial [Trichonephila clavipes]|nr:complex I assembly factor ACAD9, mitochondrial [Trichonephila clavipes]